MAAFCWLHYQSNEVKSFLILLSVIAWTQVRHVSTVSPDSRGHISGSQGSSFIRLEMKKVKSHTSHLKQGWGVEGN